MLIKEYISSGKKEEGNIKKTKILIKNKLTSNSNIIKIIQV